MNADRIRCNYTRENIEVTPEALALAGDLELVALDVPSWAKPSVRAQKQQSALIETLNRRNEPH